jgi:hypothetical protein
MLFQIELTFAGRAEQAHTRVGEGGLERAAVVVLFAIKICPARPAQVRAGSVSRIPSRVWRSSALAPVSANPTGSPVQGA